MEFAAMEFVDCYVVNVLLALLQLGCEDYFNYLRYIA